MHNMRMRLTATDGVAWCVRVSVRVRVYDHGPATTAEQSGFLDSCSPRNHIILDEDSDTQGKGHTGICPAVDTLK